MEYKAFLVALLALSALAMVPQTPAPHAGHDHAQTQPEMCGQMMAGDAAEMKATSQTLASNLAQMKAMLPLISDLNERSRWQANIGMWQAVADHFSHMAERAEHMHKMGMSCGSMDDGRGGDHTDHEHRAPPAPAKPQ
jgi:hypothetical protein